ncbi:MAG: hypothetical protein FWD83_08790 [Promicromonosporaceae bacterium]|nr:hypothetical protein [Promicromonosporaceae bacterium]
MTAVATQQIVLDAGALIGLERQNLRLLALAMNVERLRIPTYVPVGALAQAWRGGARQHALARLMNSAAILVVNLDEDSAKAVGLLLGRTGTSDVVDGHVALIARSLGAVVYTSDPTDIRAIDPSLRVEAI